MGLANDSQAFIEGEPVFIRSPKDDHPCFDPQARHTSARIHLPVAPRCNVQCRFCDRKFSCVNESRPGVTARVMTPREALEHLDRTMERMPNLRVVGIAGPGDPLANADETMETLSLVRQKYPEMLLCVSTNGLQLMRHVNSLHQLGVSHVTVTVNAVDLDIGAQVYDWVRWGNEVFRGREAAHILWDNQEMAIQALEFRQILVKVNTVCIPGVNEAHVEEISRTMARLGASLHNVIPLIPTAHTAFGHLAEPSAAAMQAVRSAARKHLPQMEHCTRCRADAVGLLGPAPILSSPDRPYLAVCTQDGSRVDLHLGQSPKLWIYRPSDAGPVLVDVREAPPVGGGSARWVAVAHLLKDCHTVAANRAGPVPQAVLQANGIRVTLTEGPVAQLFHTEAMPSRSATVSETEPEETAP